MAPYTIADCSVAGLVPLPSSGRLPEEILTAYLNRLGAQRPAAPTKEALAALLAAHVDCIAYLLRRINFWAAGHYWIENVCSVGNEGSKSAAQV